MNIEELTASLPDKERSNINEQKFTQRIPNVQYANGGQLKEWKALSMRERANIIRNSVQNHFANGGSMIDISIDDIRHQYDEGEEEDIYAKANAILDERIKQQMMKNRPSYEDWINRERNKVTQAAFEYSNQRTSPSYIMQDNPYKTKEEWLSAMNSIIEERQKELNDSIKLNTNQPPMIQQMNISIAQQKLNDAIWEKNQGYSSKIPANSCLTTATDNYVKVTGDKSYGANLNSYFQNNHPGYEVVPGFKDAIQGDIVQLLEDNGEAKHGMIYAGQNDQGQYIFNNSAGGSEDIAYKKGISFRSINNDKNPNDHVQILRFIGNDQWNKDKEEDYNLRYPAFMHGGKLFDDGGPKEILEGQVPSDLMRNDNIGFQQGYYPEVTIPKQSLYEAADNSGITLVPYLGDAVDAMQAANLAKEGKYAEAAILGSTLLIPNILEKPLKLLGKNVLRYFGQGIETIEDLRKLSDDDWYDAYRNALYNDNKESAQNIQQLRVLLKKESGQEVVPFKTNLENQYILKPSFIRDDKTYKNLFWWNWNQDRDYFYKKYRTTIGDLRKRYDNLKVQDGKRGQKLLEDIDTNKAILKQEIDQAVKEGKIPETFLEDLEFYTKDTYGRIPEYDADKHLVQAPWQNEQKLTITTDPQTGQQIYDQLPIHQDSKYRYVGKDAYKDYVTRGIVSNIDDEGKALTRYSFPMFTSRNPSSYGFDNNKIWLVSKPDAPLEWESVKGAAITPVYKGETNKTPLSMFDVFQESSEGFRKLQGFGGTLLQQFNNGGYLFAKGGPKNEQTLADEKVNYSYFLHPIDAFRYNGSPSYNTDIPFATAFTDAIRNNQENFQWGDNIYNTDIDWKHHFSKDEKGNSPFKEFAEIMYPAVIKVLQEQGLPITNAHNIVRQAAIESKYGTDPRGAQGYNLSGIKWTKSADPKYKHTTGADGEEYIDFDNLKDYLYYKVKILNDNYDALNATDAKDFARRLHPDAAGIPTNQRTSEYKGDYSKDYNSYKNNITNLNSLDKTLFHQMYKPLFGK